MVIAHHLILSAYGFWLPNDPRGSWSTFVRQWDLLRYGPATKVNTRRSIASRPHDRDVRAAAKRALRYPPVTFDAAQARSIGIGFANASKASGYCIRACSILRKHAHIIVMRHKHSAEQMTAHLKGAATRQLRAENIAPAAPSPWSEGPWKVFIDDDRHLQQAMAYVENNPVKEGLPAQCWKFVRR